jgi:hypothetical protein
VIRVGPDLVTPYQIGFTDHADDVIVLINHRSVLLSRSPLASASLLR